MSMRLHMRVHVNVHVNVHAYKARLKCSQI